MEDFALIASLCTAGVALLAAFDWLLVRVGRWWGRRGVRRQRAREIDRVQEVLARVLAELEAERRRTLHARATQALIVRE